MSNYTLVADNIKVLAMLIEQEIFVIQGSELSPNWEANLNHIDVSKIKDFSYLFSDNKKYGYRLHLFNGDISQWNVSNGENMDYMFSGADLFNGDVSNWNVSNVRTMTYMFSRATSFTGDISKWDTNRYLREMRGIFFKTDRFRKHDNLFSERINKSFQPKTLEDLCDLIYESILEQGTNDADLNHIDVSLMKGLSYLFASDSPYNYSIGGFNGDISGWNTSNVVCAVGMFKGNKHFNGDISNLDFSKLEDADGMFRDAENFDSDISGWNTSNLKYASNMFNGATSFSGDISGWDVSKLISATGMFANTRKFNSDLSNWKPIDLINIWYMFKNTNWVGDISGWVVSVICDKKLSKIFKNCKNIAKIQYPEDWK